MLHRAIATLRETLRPHLGLSKARLETLALIVVAMVSARTVRVGSNADKISRYAQRHYSETATRGAARNSAGHLDRVRVNFLE